MNGNNSSTRGGKVVSGKGNSSVRGVWRSQQRGSVHDIRHVCVIFLQIYVNGAVGKSGGKQLKMFRYVFPLSIALSLLAMFLMEYYAFYGLQYLEIQQNRLKNPYTSMMESNADVERLKAVKAAMQHAWGGYETYAWGQDELNPKSKKGKLGVLGGMNGFSGFGASIVDAMSTLHLMGLKEEFGRARDWVAENMKFEGSKKQHISFFETTIRLLGGLMSAYDLSGDPVLLEKAEDLGSRLINVFNGPRTGLVINEATLPMTDAAYSSNNVLLAELGSNLIEFATLGARTGNETFRIRAEAGIRFLHAKYTQQALLGTSIQRSTGRIQDSTVTVGAPTDSYYEYLLKYWILGGKRDNHWRDRWIFTVDEALRELKISSKNGLYTWVGERSAPGSPIKPVVTHLGCFYPGNVALGVISGAVTGEKAKEYLAFAENMTYACFQLYNQTKTGLGADGIQINIDTEEVTGLDRPYLQRPEVVESLFYLWRATHDKKYRDWGWSVVEALNTYCKEEAGYSGLSNANKIPPQSDDMQQSWFLAETLKYLYLLFADDAALDLDRWVFNTEAHPVMARTVKESYWIDWDFVNETIGRPGVSEKLQSSTVWLEKLVEQLWQSSPQ